MQPKQIQKMQQVVDKLYFTKEPDLANWKTDVDNLDIDKLEIVPLNLRNSKGGVVKLDVDKLVSTHVDLRKFSGVVKNNAVNIDVYIDQKYWRQNV